VEQVSGRRDERGGGGDQRAFAVEPADAESLYANPQHPYTRTLLDAVPVPDPEPARERRARRKAGAALSA
jgi:ABC-type oligopeptide transport system ATPase subunit